MSFFQNSTPQKRGVQSAQRGTKTSHIIAHGILPGDSFRQHDAVRTTKRHRHSSIGDHDATGLVIHGTHALKFNLGDNPDAATPPADGDSHKVPDFPISFNGLGMLAFQSPVRIPTIDGTLNVRGDIYANGVMLGGGGIETARTTFVPSLEDISGNAATMSTQEGRFQTIGAYTFFEIYVVWTGLGSMTGNIQIIPASPFPTISAVRYGHLSVKAEQGMSVSIIGNTFSSYYFTGGFKIYEDNNTTGGLTTQVQASQLATSGTIRMFGFIVSGT